MKNFTLMLSLFVAALFSASPSTAQQLPTLSAVYGGYTIVVDSTDNERWIDHSIVSGMAERVDNISTTADAAMSTAKTALSRADSLAAVSRAKKTVTTTAKKSPGYGFYTNRELAKAVESWAGQNGLADSSRAVQAKAFVQTLMAGLGSAPPTPAPAARPPANTPADSVLVSPAPVTVALDSAAVMALVERLVNARLSDLVTADSDLRADIRDVAHATATAMGAAVAVGTDSTGAPIMGKKPSGKEEKAARNWLANF